MTLKSDEPKDQAEELKNLLEELENGNDQVKNNSIIKLDSPEEKREVDILNLPPRKEIHSQNSRMHFKINKPLSRFLLVIVLLLIILLGAYYFLGNEWMS